MSVGERADVPPVDFARAERIVAERLSAEAMGHSLRTARTAAELASVYGVDSEKARLAGLFHDWDREVGRDELLARARELGVEVTPTDEVVPYLLHAHTAAEDLSRTFEDIDAEVVQAVRRHTVGAPEMSDLDRVVYLADMLEPGRRYTGVDELRALVGTVPLDELFATAYTASVRHIVESRRFLHPDTVEVWNAQVARVRR